MGNKGCYVIKFWFYSGLNEKSQTYQDDKFNVAKMMISVFDRVEKIVAFSTFPTMDWKAFFFRVVKSLDCF